MSLILTLILIMLTEGTSSLKPLEPVTRLLAPIQLRLACRAQPWQVREWRCRPYVATLDAPHTPVFLFQISYLLRVGIKGTPIQGCGRYKTDSCLSFECNLLSLNIPTFIRASLLSFMLMCHCCCCCHSCPGQDPFPRSTHGCCSVCHERLHSCNHWIAAGWHLEPHSLQLGCMSMVLLEFMNATGHIFWLEPSMLCMLCMSSGETCK